MRGRTNGQIGRRALIRFFAFAVLSTTVVTPAWTQPDATSQQPIDLEKNRALCQDKDPKIALSACTAEIDAHLDSAADLAIALNHRGLAYVRLGEFNLAIVDLNQSIRLKPDSAEALFNRGIAYSDDGDYARAVDDFDNSLKLHPGNASALYARGIAKQNQLDAAGAEADRTAARQIDPEVAGKVASLMVPAHTVTAPPIESQTPARSIPSCDAIALSLATLGQTQANHGAAPPNYVDESFDQLKKEVPALRGVKFDSEPNGALDRPGGPAPVNTALVLDQAGAVTASMLHRMPNLIAREQVDQVTGSTMDAPVGLQTGRRRQPTVQGQPTTQFKTRFYSYRIVSREDSTLDNAINEYRTDAHDHPIHTTANDPDTPRSVGFATSWLFFVPGNFNESRYRYVGQQKIGSHETYVMAFAQIPDRTHMETIVQTTGGGCSTFTQGVAWIDQSTFQIIRMQTDLLSPLPAIGLTQLRSVLNYSDVKIPKLSLSLWLPSDVETSWLSGGRTGDERHLYSNYRLFVSTVTILPPDQNPPQ